MVTIWFTRIVGITGNNEQRMCMNKSNSPSRAYFFSSTSSFDYVTCLCMCVCVANIFSIDRSVLVNVHVQTFDEWWPLTLWRVSRGWPDQMLTDLLLLLLLGLDCCYYVNTHTHTHTYLYGIIMSICFANWLMSFSHRYCYYSPRNVYDDVISNSHNGNLMAILRFKGRSDHSKARWWWGIEQSAWPLATDHHSFCSVLFYLVVCWTNWHDVTDTSWYKGHQPSIDIPTTHLKTNMRRVLKMWLALPHI